MAIERLNAELRFYSCLLLAPGLSLLLVLQHLCMPLLGPELVNKNLYSYSYIQGMHSNTHRIRIELKYISVILYYWCQNVYF